MRKAIAVLAISLLIFSHSLQAQIPGFEGHRFSVYYSGTFFPHFSNPSYISEFRTDQSASNTPSNIGINYRNNFDADYVVSRSTAVGASFKFLNTAAKNIDISSSNGDRYTYTFVDMTTKIYSIYIKKFPFEKTGFIAPVGSYYKVELALGFTSVLGDSGHATYFNEMNGGTTAPGRIHGTLPNITSLILFYTIGQQRIIAKRIYFDYGVDFGFPLTYIGRALSSGSDDEEEVFSDAKYKSDIEERLFGHIFFNVHVGAGILLF